MQQEVENEAHVSAAQSSAQAHTRISRTYEHSRWPSRVEAPAHQGPQEVDRNDSQQIDRTSLPQAEHLLHRADFLRTQTQGERFRGQKITLLLAVNGKVDIARLGFTISRKVGGAVVRNRVRRRLRELCRHHNEYFVPGFDYVIIAAPQAAGCTYASLGDELTALLKRSHAWASQKKSS